MPESIVIDGFHSPHSLILSALFHIKRKEAYFCLPASRSLLRILDLERGMNIESKVEKTSSPPPPRPFDILGVFPNFIHLLVS